MLASRVDSRALARVNDSRTSCYILHDEPVVVLCCSCFTEIIVGIPGTKLYATHHRGIILYWGAGQRELQKRAKGTGKGPVGDIDLT
jgi:hypothetical protein